MERETSEVSYPARYDLGINPNQGVVEIGSNPSTHPLRSGRTKPTPEEIATVLDTDGKPTIDPVVLMSVSNMDNGY